jgi:recombination associated protein RdgC
MFKNLKLFTLGSAGAVAEKLIGALGQYPFAPCGSFEVKRSGWVPPCPESDDLAFTLPGHVLIKLRIEEKKVPAKTLNRVCAERADEIAAQQGYAPGRKQRREIKERVQEELLTKVLPRQQDVFVWIDTANGWLGIDTGSSAVADEVVHMLVKAAGDDFPLAFVRVEHSPEKAMTEWLLAGEGPDGFTIDRELQLKSPLEDKAVISFTRCDVAGDESVREHLSYGKVPSKLGLVWDDRIAFVLTNAFDLRKLAFLDVLKSRETGEGFSDSGWFAADVALITGSLPLLLRAMVAALGGFAKPNV